MVKNGARISWGFSEREYGSDVLANQMTAVKKGDDYLLNGEKWLIGNAGRSEVFTIFARTKKRGGPGGFSIFAVEKKDLPRDRFTLLQREKVVGLRAMDLSGVRFDQCPVPASALVGIEGHGLEYALKATQVVRTMIGNIVVGCSDTALRVTLTFARNRQLFNETVDQIPYSQRQLVECFSDLLVSDIMLICATRALQVSTNQFSVWSSVIKYFMPTMLEKSICQMAVVLGARYFLRETFMFGVFQKMMRDMGVSSLADGNTVVNLKSISLQLEGLLEKGVAAQSASLDTEMAERLSTIFDLDRCVPSLDTEKLELIAEVAMTSSKGLRAASQDIANPQGASGPNSSSNTPSAFRTNSPSSTLHIKA